MTMKIVHIYRPSRSGGHSIEIVFKTIAVELRKQGIAVIDYELGPKRRMVTDIWNLWRLKADAYHVTGDVNYWVALLPRSRTVLTIHDIGHYLYGLTGWRKVAYKWLWLSFPIRLATQITAVSDVTGRNLMTYLCVPTDRVFVIEDCYSADFFSRSKPFNKVCPRILQIGTGRNKNVLRLIQALEGMTCTLVIVGKLNADITAALQTTGIPYENHVDISQTAIIEQYAAADLVSFVSTSEGFGMPIIEAQAMGRPLITSNLPPMSVVAGPEACVVDPLNIASIRAGLAALIHDDAYRVRVVDAGLKNVPRYSASTAAAKYLDVYQRLLQFRHRGNQR